MNARMRAPRARAVAVARLGLASFCAAAILGGAGCAATAPVPASLPPAAGGSAGPADAAQFTEAGRARAAAWRELLADMTAGGAGSTNVSALEREVPSPDSLRRRIEPDRALLVYRLGTPHTSLWVVTREGWRRFELPEAAAIEGRIDTLRQLIVRPDLAVSLQAQRSARRLYMMLVASAEPMIRTKREIAIVPDGALWLLPFETLLALEPTLEGRVPKRGYLIERWSVAYAVSAEAGVAPPPRDVLGGVLALGDPLYANPDAPEAAAPVPPLPKTALELAVLDQQARSREGVTLVGTQATRARLLGEPLLADAGVVHLATHAVAVDDDPARSGLWLAAGEDDGPGHLRARDIAGLELRARLVTLTQCETASEVGPHAGRGVRALAGAFFAAGAQQVMLSLWKPVDRTTGLMLDRFYRDYLRRGRTAPEALADAKRQMLRKNETRSPFLWGPLVVIEGVGAAR